MNFEYIERYCMCKTSSGTNEVKMNKETNTIIREGVEAIINPFDTYAVEEGLRIKDKTAGKVTVLSMGIPQCCRTIKGNYWS